MNWQDYIDYLKDNILEEKQHTTQLEYQLRPSAQEKYPVANPNQLVNALEELIISHEQRFDIENYYHKLPDCVEYVGEEGEEEEVLIDNWSKIFPKRKETFFGRVKISENHTFSTPLRFPYSQEVWTNLASIYEDWVENLTLVEKLTQQAEQFQTNGEAKIEKWFLKNQAKLLYQEKGIKILTELKEWLTKYEQLSEKQKEELIEPKQKNVELKNTLEEVLLEEKNKKSKEQKAEQNWYQDIPWQKIALYAGGGLFIIFLIWLVKKYLS